MPPLCTFMGRSSFTAANEKTEVFVSSLGGNLVACFDLGKKVNPYFVAPWWKEGWTEELPPLLNVCRGNFFACPMGGDLEAYSGEKIPLHGECANGDWQLDFKSEGMLGLIYEKGSLQIRKEVILSARECAVYEKNVVSGMEGSFPVAYHPMLQLPQKKGAAHLKLGNVLEGYTTPKPHEQAEKGGYFLCVNHQTIHDITRVKTIYGDFEDFSRQPIRTGYEEILFFVNDAGKRFGYAAVTYAEDGYVYYQLKNPRIFSGIMLWVSNGGRHYAPWNGRCRNVLALEDTTSYFHYGVAESARRNFINEQGVKTAVEMEKNREYVFPIIYGAAKTPDGFTGVEAIEETPGGIMIIGTKGEKILQHLDMGYLGI